MPAEDLLIHALKLQLETTSRACALFDSAALWHSTEECALSGPGQAARIGVHLYCNKDVSGLAFTHMHCPSSPVRLFWIHMAASDLQ